MKIRSLSEQTKCQVLMCYVHMIAMRVVFSCCWLWVCWYLVVVILFMVCP